MDYKFNWKSPVVPRIIFLAISILAFGYFMFDRGSYIVALTFLAITLFQIKQLIDMVDQSNKDIASFLDSVSFDDFSATFKTDSKDPYVQRFHDELNEALAKLRNKRQEKDTEYLFYKNIVMHVGIGLVIFNEHTGKIEICNSAARKLLKVTKADVLDDLKEIDGNLVHIFQKLKTGGRELIRLKIGEDIFQLSIYAIELTLRGENMKLISLQNIQSELEEKEMEAWQNLVRVLTHEIMNSVTPISSLAGTMEDEIRDHVNATEDKPLQREQLADIHLSLQTISKRSENLIQFVKEFRSLTHIPKPRLQSFLVCSLLDEIAMLHKKELTEKNIRLTIELDPPDLTILADRGLIEQVLINLVKNASQAFEDQEEKNITIRGYFNDKLRPVISVKDNGTGIDPEALEKIFIPFFTTKKTGSGIGLSLSRQIMRQHQGSLTVKSTVGKGTEFFMRF
ncbi:MAG: HAMP domain-containing histidine kinase [Cyclobacteriaceae bacterium]|nr:HAMP domain-containing histidine kinase [Cyclobacteriaceae bacterium]UYN87728.1 MAG: HAMP domain-containing histidine kinase [Cyclobacteriaceae bacterium]